MSLTGGAVAFTPIDQSYSYEQITSARDGLNPVCKELYLTDEDFRRVFGMDQGEFYRLPPWKQREKKKRVGLF